MERLLLHSADHDRHRCYHSDQQPVCFQTVDDRIAGRSKCNDGYVYRSGEKKQKWKFQQLFYSIVFAHCPRFNIMSTTQAVICIWLPTVSDMKVKQSIDRL